MAENFERRVSLGASMRPAIWRFLDEVASESGYPRNAVLEQIVSERFGLAMPEAIDKAIDTVRNRHQEGEGA